MANYATKRPMVITVSDKGYILLNATIQKAVAASRVVLALDLDKPSDWYLKATEDKCGWNVKNPIYPGSDVIAKLRTLYGCKTLFHINCEVDRYTGYIRLRDKI